MSAQYTDNKCPRMIVVAMIALVLVIGCEGAQPPPSPVSPTAIPIRPTATPVSEATPPTATAPPPTATPTPPIQAIVPEMVLVEPGSFQMGSADGESDERPVHTVHITRPFYIARHELTFDQYDQFCDETIGKNRPPDQGRGRGALPVVVTWRDAVAYCNWLSEKHGLTPCYSGKGRLTQCDFAANGYRLPTEAEWEYAARGGHLSQGYIYAGSNDVDEVAWYGGNSGGWFHPVGQKKPNELGLYDMSGNMPEWCWDWYRETYYAASPANDPTGPAAGNNPGNVYGSDRVLRGSNCMQDPYFLRVTFRGADGEAWPGGGIRLVRTKPLTSSGVIAFTSERDGEGDIYVMTVPDGTNADGAEQGLGNPRRLTHDPAYDAWPAWSPDGSQIAFVSTRSGNPDIYVMDADGSNLRQLTQHSAKDIWPEWSPDGTRIAFTSRRDGNWEIYTMAVPDGADSDGIDLQRLTDTSSHEDFPAWSPDGTQIVFSRTGGDDGTYVMSVLSRDERRLADFEALEPAWSPDGTRIAFGSDHEGFRGIYVMDADGSNLRKLSKTRAGENCPAWSPDGTRITFASWRDGDGEIYVMDADGGNLKKLTNNRFEDEFPAWRPDSL